MCSRQELHTAQEAFGRSEEAVGLAVGDAAVKVGQGWTAGILTKVQARRGPN